MAVCPHCLLMSSFTLRRMNGGVHLFGFSLFEFDRAYLVACGSCRYRRDIAEAEVLVAMAAKDLYRQHAAKQLDAARYAEAVGALEFPTINALRRAAQVWQCAVCGETVPVSFVACWKCTTPRPSNAPLQTPS